MSRARRGLGRGLEALIPRDETSVESEVREVSVNDIRENRFQPRVHVDEEGLEELARSIQNRGVIQPVVVRRIEGGFELVAGERRWRAAMRAGLERIPALIRDLSDLEVMEVALIENLQREDLSPIEEALAYRALMERFGLTQDQIARAVGKSRPHVANTLRLLSLEQEVQKDMLEGRLSMGHALLLLGVEDVDERQRIARRIRDEGLSVRAAASLTENAKARVPVRGRKRKSTGGREEGAMIAFVEDRLRQVLGTKVRVRLQGRGGVIEIEFYDEDDLQRLVEIISGKGSEMFNVKHITPSK